MDLTRPNCRPNLVSNPLSGVGYGLCELLLRHPIPTDSVFAPRNPPHPSWTAAEPDETPYKVIMACRDKSRAEAARKELWDAYVADLDAQEAAGMPIPPSLRDESRLRVEELDVADVNSVKAFASRMLKVKQPVDRLVCNAGIMPNDGLAWRNVVNIFIRPQWVFQTGGNIVSETAGLKTNDGTGMGLVFAANVFGHYALVGLRTRGSDELRWTWCCQKALGSTSSFERLLIISSHVSQL